MEQIQFFNGDILYLTKAANSNSLRWLTSQAPAKMEFLEKYIVPYRLSKATCLEHLKSKLNLATPSKEVKILPPAKTSNKESFTQLWQRMREEKLPLSDDESSYENEHETTPPNIVKKPTPNNPF